MAASLKEYAAALASCNQFAVDHPKLMTELVEILCLEDMPDEKIYLLHSSIVRAGTGTDEQILRNVKDAKAIMDALFVIQERR